MRMLLIINRLSAVSAMSKFKRALGKWQNLLRNLWSTIYQVNDVGAPFLGREKALTFIDSQCIDNHYES